MTKQLGEPRASLQGAKQTFAKKNLHTLAQCERGQHHHHHHCQNHFFTLTCAGQLSVLQYLSVGENYLSFLPEVDFDS